MTVAELAWTDLDSVQFLLKMKALQVSQVSQNMQTEVLLAVYKKLIQHPSKQKHNLSQQNSHSNSLIQIFHWFKFIAPNSLIQSDWIKFNNANSSTQFLLQIYQNEFIYMNSLIGNSSKQILWIILNAFFLHFSLDTLLTA